jgi:hypothetical protein
VDESDAWFRWWKTEGLYTMRGLLWDRWDPINARCHAPDDEYDDEFNQLARKLREGQSAAELANWLSSTEREYLGLASEARSSDELMPIARLLIAWYADTAAPRPQSS